jgi:hypothetical protein
MHRRYGTFEDLNPTPMKTNAQLSRKQTGKSIPSFVGVGFAPTAVIQVPRPSVRYWSERDAEGVQLALIDAVLQTGEPV